MRTFGVMCAAVFGVAVGCGLDRGGTCVSEPCGVASTAGDADASVPAPLEGGPGPAADDASMVTSPDATPTPPCDTTKDPHDAPCLVTDDTGVFVAPSGSDKNEGTKDAPVATIARGLEQAIARKKARVFICAASFREKVSLDEEHAGLSLHGGLTCPATPGAVAWAFEGKQTLVGSTTNEYALEVDGVKGTVNVQDIRFEAKNGTARGDNSIAVLVRDATVVFRRVAMIAGDGVDGQDGQAISNYTTLPTGNPGVGGLGGAKKDNTCVDGLNPFGGEGGIGGVVPTAGGRGGPLVTGADGGAPGTLTTDCTEGQSGASSFVFGSGGAGATLGGRSKDTWAPGAGADGTSGKPGTGGGGGGGSADAAGAILLGGGGSGGVGGCGGGFGTGGKGGGASIALLSLDATVTLDACRLEASTAGDGGRGGNGQFGQGGGQPGAAATSGGCAGGVGGNGAPGAPGGGGAGGVSVGILWFTTQPVVTKSQIAPGTPGKAGPGGLFGKDGVQGRAEMILNGT